MSALSKTNVSIQLTAPVVRAVKKGHPWIFDKGIVKQNKEASPGSMAVLYDQKRNFVGIGLYDPESPIRIRVLHRGKPVTIDTDWLKERLNAVIGQRAELIHNPKTTGYRLVSGENDLLPGMVVDRYDTTLVIKIYTSAWLPHLAAVQSALLELVAPERIVVRLSRFVAASPVCPEELNDGTVVHGPELSGPVIFTENGIQFEADPILGQKTGFFLDQRENRARVGRMTTGKSVLNVFSYSGGFSLYAAQGGAASVSSLDISLPAMDACVRNFELNSENDAIAKTPHHLICEDAFEALKKMAESGKKFDMVILDPPSFAQKKADVPGAIKAYEKLIKLGLRVLKPGGTLVAASCSARVAPDVFFDTVIRAAALAKRPLKEIERTGHAKDHPVVFPEGEYLKCLFATG